MNAYLPVNYFIDLALKRLEVNAYQAVFVDDMQRNVDGARLVGLHGIRFLNPMQMRLDLEQLLNGYNN